ncbi:DinB family protein [Actinoplanes sp. NPDC051851]|uniref:DinB family protein n=1 Tax=Actinoplanes sp. NPDC051851 TaxID=3154753 RepID=UPI003416B264
MTQPDLITDLQAEQDRLAGVLTALSPADWSRRSAAAGWTIADVVLHLAQTEEAVTGVLTGAFDATVWRQYGESVDEVMSALVNAAPSTPPEILSRWQTARRTSIQALRTADPDQPVPWVAAPLKPRTLATTRLAEHWAHGLDITAPLGLDWPDTARLRHVAWLGFGTLPYAFRLAGRTPKSVFCDLTAPDGSRWRFGDPTAASTIEGPAAAFCRVGARRLSAAESGLVTRGPDAAEALRLLRNYA